MHNCKTEFGYNVPNEQYNNNNNNNNNNNITSFERLFNYEIHNN
jgi:hypothetical protein